MAGSAGTGGQRRRADDNEEEGHINDVSDSNARMPIELTVGGVYCGPSVELSPHATYV